MMFYVVPPTMGSQSGAGGESLLGGRSQATVLGLVLVLGMVLTGTAVVITLGETALSDTQTTSELERAENSMTLFNTRTAMVALGNSPSQTVSFGQDSGDIESIDDSGWLRVTHNNYNSSNDDEVIFNRSLGSVVYTNNDVQIAYQGGGVWRKSGIGAAIMISPPEFHYRGATLTLPVVRVRNSASTGAGTTATIDRSSETKRVYPNETGETPGTNEVGAPYNGTDDPYTNPVVNGTVDVTVQSEYYQGWASYFRQRTDGNVTVDDSQNRVSVELTTLSGSVGDFEMPAEGNGLGVNGIGDDHPVNEYTLNLSADNSGKNFNNMHWAFYADNGNEQLEFHFYSDGKCKGGSPQNFNGDIDMSIYYYNTSGSETIHEEWQNVSVNANDTNDGSIDNTDFNVNCDNYMLNVSLMSDTELEYNDIQLTGSNNKWYYGPDIDSLDVDNETNSFTTHDNGTVDMGNYTTGETEELGFLVNHYLQLLGPNFNLQVTDGPGGSSRIDESGSTGNLDFDTASGAEYITYLHITENNVEVTFD